MINAISNRRKDHKDELSIYLPSNLFGIFMQNYKMFIGTGNAKHASGKY